MDSNVCAVRDDRGKIVNEWLKWLKNEANQALVKIETNSVSVLKG